MERMLHKGNLLLTLVALLATTMFYGQSAGFNTSFIVLKINNGSNQYYDLQAATGNPDFNGANLGTFCQGTTTGIVFKGAEHNIYKCGGCDLTSTRIYYRIYPTGSPSGSFVSNSIGFASGFNNGCGGADQQWANSGYNTNLLSGLTGGNYTIEVYSDASVTCSGGTVYAGNGGANYKATFTVTSTTTYYADADGDGYGNPVVTTQACSMPGGFVGNSLDCADNDPAINPAAAEICNGIDDDCDGFIDDSDPSLTGGTTFYADADGDGFGDPMAAIQACAMPVGHVADGTDCDDDDDAVHPNATEICNGIDDDCDGLTDGDDSSLSLDGLSTFYADGDNDGYGDPAVSIVTCTQPVGYVTDNTDCNDSLAAVNPGHAEILYNGVDDNCDGNFDEGFEYTTNVQGAQCGTTLSTINSFIVAVSKPNVTRHRFEVTDTTTNVVQILERYQNYFSPTMLPSYDYATTYSVRVQIQRNGVWLGYYGPSCLVATPAVLVPGGAASVSPSQCGATLTSISKLVATTSLPNVTGYRFRITNASDLSAPNQIQVIDRGPYNWFALTMLPTFNYGTTYLVEVSIKTNGVFSNYGSPCAVTAPAAPTLANCGAAIAAKGTLVSTVSLDRVTSYRFEITNMATTQVTTLDRSQNWFTFNHVPGFTPGGAYAVRISVMTSGVYSLPGESCEITAPASARTNDSEPMFDAVAHPNPFSDSFNIHVTTAAESLVNIKVYDMTGRLIEAKIATIADMQTLHVGETYPSGVYNIVVTQGAQVKTMRVMKR